MFERQPVIYGDVTSKRIRSNARDAVSALDVVHIRSGRDDDTREIVAKPKQVLGRARVHSQRFHDVSEIDSPGPHTNFDLIRTRRTSVGFVQRQLLQNTRLGHLQLERSSLAVFKHCFASPLRDLVQRHSLQSIDETLVLTQGDFTFVVVACNLVNQVVNLRITRL